MLKSFDEVIEKVKAFPQMKRCGVCMADKAAIEGALEAEKIGLAEPVFIGHKDEILEILGENKDYKIIDVKEPSEGAKKVVEMVRNNEVDFILKGHIETAVLMREVVNSETGLRTNRTMSHMSFEEIPSYHKIFTVTDGGMCPSPDVEMKQKIVENAVEIYHKLGYEKPKVAVLSCIEKVNPKMPSTVDAAELKARNERGEIADCIIEGPISFDLAYSKRTAALKDYESEVAGDADIFVAPDIQAGNILEKSINFAGQSKMAGFIVGAKCLIILTSRSATAEEKYLSIAMAALAND